MIENLLNQLQQIAKDSENDRCFLAIDKNGVGIVLTKDDVVCEFDNLEQLVSRLAQATNYLPDCETCQSDSPYFQKQLGKGQMMQTGNIRH